MKSLAQSFLLPAIILLWAGVSLAQKPAASKTIPNRVEILDFHNEHRCATCLEIERLVKKILADHYSTQTKKGLITFQLINVDDKDNLPLVRKYTAYGTTLIIRSFKDGKETHVDLTNFAFLNYNKQEKFNATIKKELNAMLARVKS